MYPGTKLQFQHRENVPFALVLREASEYYQEQLLNGNLLAASVVSGYYDEVMGCSEHCVHSFFSLRISRKI